MYTNGETYTFLDVEKDFIFLAMTSKLQLSNRRKLYLCCI